MLWMNNYWYYPSQKSSKYKPCALSLSHRLIDTLCSKEICQGASRVIIYQGNMLTRCCEFCLPHYRFRKLGTNEILMDFYFYLLRLR